MPIFGSLRNPSWSAEEGGLTLPHSLLAGCTGFIVLEYDTSIKLKCQILTLWSQ